ncbi:protein YgfX [Jeongeupia sp. USM3]|uniref:protein YgfX n=1 Tax=Jeongeupia sp. USM3 TaxID=1906741 RepID=UPI00089DD8B5|nr:protein YgfX [Jeongeupia sp. USM3]AOX99044.1 hypothetical protein BJP62_00405 [Jeongeupia sp. USM3]
MSLRLRPSRLRRRLAVVVGLAAIASAAASPWPWNLAGAVWLAIAAWFERRRVAPAGIAARDDGTVVLEWPDGLTTPARILPSSRVGLWLVALRLDGAHGRSSLLLWPDSADAETLRQWRIWLCWARPGLPGAGGRKLAPDQAVHARP